MYLLHIWDRPRLGGILPSQPPAEHGLPGRILPSAHAMAPAPPSQVTIEGMVSPNTTLKWAKVAGAAGYKVYWRLTTSPQWTWGREVGDVSEHTLKNIVIDNYIFGVASVNAGGIESPVVFPGVIGAFWE